MSHISTPAVTAATDEDLRHLQACEKCRSRIVTDVDLTSVRFRVLSEAAIEQRLVTRPRPRLVRAWLAGVTAAAAMLILFVPLILINGGQVSETQTGTEDAVSPPESGLEKTLTGGENWSIAIWPRGSEICIRHSNRNPVDQSGTSGSGCVLPSEFQIPNVLNAQFGTSVDGDQPIEGEILGFVTEKADRLAVTFESGESIDIELGKTIYLGYRGFGLPRYDATKLGWPDTLEVFDGDTSLGVYKFERIPGA